MRNHIRVLMILAMLAPTSAGCGGDHPKIHRAGDALISCAESHAGSIVADVAALLLGGGSDWKSGLEGIGKSAGQTALACAVKSVSDAIASEQNGSGKATSSSPARARAAEIIADHGWQYE